MNHRWLVVVAALWLGACQQEPPTAPTPEVVVSRAEEHDYRPEQVFVGRLSATDDVDIKAKVSGYIKRRDFQEGDMVAKGDLLYIIDPAPYEAELAKARANLAKARAALDVAQRNYRRGQELVGKGAISASEMDRLTAGKLEGEAELQAAQAQLESAQVNLSYTTIRAPLWGRTGRSKFSVGDLVGPDSGALTSLVSLDPIKATFQVSEAIFLQEQQEIETEDNEFPEIQVELELTNGERYPYLGNMDFISNRIDEQTGTIQARASIPNPDGTLRPGLYVRVHVRAPRELKVVMVPQAAVQVDQQGDFLLEVDADNTVQRRNVKLGERVQDQIIVHSGIDAGARVIVRGVQKARPGQPVQIKEASAPPLVTE